MAANPTPSSSQFHRNPLGIFWMDWMLSEKNKKAIRTTAEIEIVIIPKRFLRIDSFILEDIEIFSCSFFKYRRDKPIACHSTAIVREFYKLHCIIKHRNLQQQFVNFPATTAKAGSIRFFYTDWMESEKKIAICSPIAGYMCEKAKNKRLVYTKDAYTKRKYQMDIQTL